MSFPSTYSLIGSAPPKPWSPGSDTTALLRTIGKWRAPTMHSPRTVIQYIGTRMCLTHDDKNFTLSTGALLVLFKQYHYAPHATPVEDPFRQIESQWSGIEGTITSHSIGTELFLACSHLAYLSLELAHEKVCYSWYTKCLSDIPL